MEFRQDYFLLILLVISTFQIYFQETVEFHLVCLDGEFLVPLVGSYLDVRLQYSCISHLGSDGAFPDEAVKSLLLWCSVDFHIVDICRTDGFVRLLCALRMGLVLAGLRIVLAVILLNELLGCVQCQAGKVSRVSSHVCDETSLVKTLCDTHCLAHGKTQLSGRFLLQCRCGERRCRCPGALLLLNAAYVEYGIRAVLQELTGLVNAIEPGIEHGIDLHSCGGAFRMEDGGRAVVRLALESENFPFAVDDESQCDALYASGRELRLDFSPENRRKLEAYETVEHASCLLRIHEVHVNVPRVFYCVQNRILGDFVEYDSSGAFFFQAESFIEMP